MLELNSVTKSAHTPVTVIHVKGDIDSSTFQSFQGYLEGRIEEGARHVLLDFEGLGRIGSAGLRVIHNLFHRLRDIHRDVDDDELRKKMNAGAYKSPYLKICRLPANPLEIFKLGGFDIYIEIFDDVESAVESFK